MTLQEITAKMKEGAAKKSSFGNTVKFSTDQGVVFIDGNASPPNVSNDDKDAESYEYRSSFRRAQYYGELHWGIAEPVLRARIGLR